MLLSGLSALRTQERMAKASDHDNSYIVSKDKYATVNEQIPSPEDFVAHTTSALAPVAWHIIKGLSSQTDSMDSEGDPQQ